MKISFILKLISIICTILVIMSFTIYYIHNNKPNQFLNYLFEIKSTKVGKISNGSRSITELSNSDLVLLLEHECSGNFIMDSGMEYTYYEFIKRRNDIPLIQLLKIKLGKFDPKGSDLKETDDDFRVAVIGLLSIMSNYNRELYYNLIIIELLGGNDIYSNIAQMILKNMDSIKDIPYILRILEIVKSEKDIKKYKILSEILSEYPEIPEVFEWLFKETYSESQDRKLDAVRSISNIVNLKNGFQCNERIINRLMELLQDKDSEIRAYTVYSLKGTVYSLNGNVYDCDNVKAKIWDLYLSGGSCDIKASALHVMADNEHSDNILQLLLYELQFTECGISNGREIISAIGDYGSAARDALPILENYLKGDNNYSTDAQKAIRKISGW